MGMSATKLPKDPACYTKIEYTRPSTRGCTPCVYPARTPYHRDAPAGGDAYNEARRTSLLRWVVDIATRLRVTVPATVRTIMLCDLFMHTREASLVMRPGLVANRTLVLACLVIAAKFEDMYPPTISDYVHESQHICTARQLVAAEREVLMAINYGVASTTWLDMCDFEERLWMTVPRMNWIVKNAMDVETLRKPPSEAASIIGSKPGFDAFIKYM